jgi:hypothetical protein
MDARQVTASLLLAVIFACRTTGATLHAQVMAAGAGDCSSWSDACTLGTAITNATSGDEVWAKSGTYAPIALKNGVRIIGGFTGTTETSASQSNPTANQTIIDGNGARAVESEDNNSATVLRGFYIRNGNDTETDGGGGMLLDDSSPMIVNCVFEDNLATWWGAAVAIRGTSSPQFINCTFRDNGWVDDQDNTNVKPLAGAAVFIYSGSPTFVNCLFHDNVAGEGAVLANTDRGSATFVNCTMADNSATVGDGGAVHDRFGDVVIRNSILWGNTADEGPQIYSTGSSVTTVTYSDVQGGWGGAGNISSDPKFWNPSSDDYKLLLNSPCKEKGHNPSLPTDIGDLDWDGNTSETLPLDLGLNPRTKACNVDMGAYEVQAGTCGGGGME